MLKLNFSKNKKIKILCLGAHSDDIEIGCGATLLKFQEEFFDLDILWVVFSGNEIRGKEALRSANEFLRKTKLKKTSILNFKESYFPFIGDKIKDSFENIKNKFSPDLIFTHYRDDAHQDHRLICELTWNTFRNHLILEYEIPKYDGDLGTPNLFVSIDKKQLEKKIELIFNNFKSQSEKGWFSPSTFRGLLRLRGIESNSKTGYAEGFYCRKIIL